MKTLTELSGTLIRMASAAMEEAKRSLPAEPVPAAPPASTAAEAVVPAPDAAEAVVPAADAAEAVAPAADAAEAVVPEADAAEAVAPEGGAAPAESGPRDARKTALQEAVGKATGLSGDRLGFLCAAVEAVGGRVADVRLVRVFGGEEPVSGAKTVAGHQYLVDMMPSSMKQIAGGQRDEGGKRGGRGGRGGGGGGGGGGRSGGGGAKAGATGGFSMDSLREDRKNERGRGGGGRPSGRGPAGGGRGGGRGGPPAGGSSGTPPAGGSGGAKP